MRTDDYIVILGYLILGAVAGGAMWLAYRFALRADRSDRRAVRAEESRDRWHGRWATARAAEQEALSRFPAPGANAETVTLPRVTELAETVTMPAVLQDAT